MNTGTPPESVYSKLIADASAVYERAYGVRPAIGAVAPGRVNLIGEHVDYCDGCVMPMAIPLYTVMVGSAAPDRRESRVTTTAAGDVVGGEMADGGVVGGETTEATFSLAPAVERRLPAGVPKWASYVVGVAQLYSAQKGKAVNFNAVIASSVPIGGGLSSSASLEVATLMFVQQLHKESKDTLSIKTKALLCQRAEHEYAGVPCGIMDQFVVLGALAGHVIKINCRSLDYMAVPWTSDTVAVLVTNSNVKHELSGSEYSDRRKCEKAASLLGKKSLRDVTLEYLNANGSACCLDTLTLRRARHVVTEMARVESAVGALSSGDFALFGQLMNASHLSLRDDFEVSCDELDSLVTVAQSCAGVYGSRMTGGGFGGCTVTLVEKDRLDNVKQTIRAKYNGTPTFYECTPVDGAKAVQI